MQGYYFLTEVDGMWFLVEHARRADWDAWLHTPSLAGLFVPDYAKRLNDPGDLIFKDPRERQYGDARLLKGEWA